MMLVFLDFEASSLARHSYPIEVAWVFEDGTSESHLIRPAPGWEDWSEGAQAIHHIPRASLLRDGTPHDVLARRMVERLSGHDLTASAPSWDGKWLSRLLRAGGFPRHAVRLTDTDAGLSDLASALLAPFVPSSEIHRATRKILAYAGDRFAGRRHAHRALPDAELERERWLVVSQLAHAYGKGAGSDPLHTPEPAPIGTRC